MPRVNINDVDNYNTGGSAGGFFQLKKDKEKKRVRFMLETLDDLNEFTYVTHNVKIKGKDSKFGEDVNCLRNYNDPVDVCPLCAAGLKTHIKVYVPVWSEDEEKVQIWSRGKRMIDKLQGLMTRYKDFPSHIFEIERHGKENSQDTTYEIYEDDQDDTTLEDLDELPVVEGIAVKNYSADDMEYFLEAGEFPPEDDDEEEDIPTRRRDKKKSKKSHDEEEDVRPRRSRRPEPEEEEEDDDEEEERPVKKKKKRRHSDEF